VNFILASERVEKIDSEEEVQSEMDIEFFRLTDALDANRKHLRGYSIKE
jgi:hypothetical protein